MRPQPMDRPRKDGDGPAVTAAHAAAPALREAYARYDAIGLTEAFARGELDRTEVALDARQRVARLNAHLGFVAHDFEGLDLPRARSDGPLAGVPFFLKDELEFLDSPMTFGARVLKDLRCERTHPFVAKLLDAGLQPMGRTTMSEFGLLPISEPVHTDPCRNPWSLAHSTGGSSGGAASAVASGAVPFAHAADGGGSIRIPASACGLVGLKPSRGRTPSALTDPPFGFVSQLCVSRTVRDTAAFLDAVSGSSPGRYWVPAPETPFRSAADRAPPRLRIAYSTTGVYGESAHPEVASALLATARRLEAVGHHVEAAEAPFSGEEMGRAFGILWAAAAGVTLKLMTRVLETKVDNRAARALLTRRGTLRQLMNIPDRHGPRMERFTRWLIQRDLDCTPSELWLAHIVFNELGEKLEGWLRDPYDLWLTPTLMRPPMRIGELDMASAVPGLHTFWRRPHRTSRQLGALPTSTDDQALERRLLGYVGFTPIANITGLPAISLPMGMSSEGLPLGMQLMAPLGDEATLISMAAEWERQHPWPTQAPEL